MGGQRFFVCAQLGELGEEEEEEEEEDIHPYEFAEIESQDSQAAARREEEKQFCCTKNDCWALHEARMRRVMAAEGDRGWDGSRLGVRMRHVACTSRSRNPKK